MSADALLRFARFWGVKTPLLLTSRSGGFPFVLLQRTTVFGWFSVCVVTKAYGVMVVLPDDDPIMDGVT